MAEGMLRIRFFAAIRENIGRSTLELPRPTGVSDIASLVRHLDATVLPGCAALLLADNTLVAVNREVAAAADAVADNDEIAFYPPVTGG